MGFQALLFCPDEKTARAVTQVLSELEFNVESCNEPFAAVKKLMGAHFDAIVVDCDNEQNAALLFKSARNSTSNQSSLAVAVVEGQAGVAKAFRIGANLVLTKPINIEQAKGTLRVARGLLRKGDPAKPAAPGATGAVAATSSTATAKLPAGAPAAPAARPATATAKPAPVPVRPAQAATANSAATSAVARKAEPVLPEAKRPVAAAPAVSAPAVEASSIKPAAHAPVTSLSAGAATAPAPAREILDIPPTEVKPSAAPREDDEILDAPGASTSPKDVPPPSFTFGGSNVPAESSGGKKKVFIGIAAALVVAGALYGGWTYYQGHKEQPNQAPFVNPIRPVNTPASAPSNAQPAAPVTATPVTEPASQPAAQPAATKPSPDVVTDDTAAGDNTPAPAASSSKAKGSASTPANKPAPEPDQPEAAPLVVKGGATAAKKVAATDADTAAPSMIGIAAPGSSGPLNLGSASDGAKPVLQRLNISQGVSTGLLIKKVDPLYPPNALRMRVEGAVQMQATISKNGDITRVLVLSGDKLLSGAAVDAVKRWKYKPYLLNGEPVEIDTQITVNFRLPH